MGHTRVRPCGVERQLYAFPRRRIPRRKTREGRDRPLRRILVAPSGRKGDPAWPPAENRRGILASVILSEAKDLFSDGALYTGEILRAFRTTGADDPAVAGAAGRGESFFGLRPQHDRLGCGLGMTGWAAVAVRA